jgi:hypothetical protein
MKSGKSSVDRSEVISAWDSGDSQTLGTGVVLGEPGFVLGESGRRGALGSTGRKTFHPAEISEEGVKNGKRVDHVPLPFSSIQNGVSTRNGK